jgi:hypothetical protein
MTADPTNFWKEFGDPKSFVEVTCDDSDNLAYEVLRAYGINSNSNVGGGLTNLDIKRMDAIQVIKLSLLEASARDGVIYEPIMSAEGTVEFLAVGTYTGLSGGDIYYEIQSGTFREDCGGVMVTGAKPLAYRREVSWEPIWQDGPKQIYETGILHNDCIEGGFNQNATIVFTDPHLDTSYKDGINNLYEITAENPYDSIMGWARYIYWEGSEYDTEAVVTRQNNAKIIIRLNDNPTLGTLVRRPTYAEGNFNNPNCYIDQGETVNPADGVQVPIPSEFRYENVRGTIVDKFQGVLDVYVQGLEISNMRGEAPSDKSASNTNPAYGDADVLIRIDKTYTQLKKLSRGTHYEIAYDNVGSEEGADVYIVFADNSRVTDPILINGDELTTYKVDPECEYANDVDSLIGEGLILPISQTGGWLIQDIYVSLLIETPSIEVYHPDGINNKALEIAESLEYLITPLVVVDEPAPIAFNGRLLDLTQSIRDHDPTTAQDFSDTELEQAQDEMSGNGMSLSLSFLEAEDCERLSGALYEYMNSGDGTEATYICSPDAEVTLGGTAPNGGIVNSIVYSYQDSNSYTISVNAGPMVVGGFSQVDGGPSPKGTEEMSAKGTIIQDLGNHVHYKVRIDGFGERVAINMAPAVLRVGDKVQVSVHNVPVEA